MPSFKYIIYVCVCVCVCVCVKHMHVCMCAQSLSCVQIFVTPWTVAHQVPLSVRFFQQEYWIGLLFPPPEDLLDSGMEPMFPALAGSLFSTELGANLMLHYITYLSYEA